MKRLTKRDANGAAHRYGCRNVCAYCRNCNCDDMGEMVERLTAYEDSGLTPKQVSFWGDCIKEPNMKHLVDMFERIEAERDAYKASGLTPERAAELGKADADGRVVIRNPLPPVKGRLFDDISDKLADKANMPCYRCPTCGALVAERSFDPDRDFSFFNFCLRCGQEIAHADAPERAEGGGA